MRRGTRPGRECSQEHSRGGTSPSCRRNPRSGAGRMSMCSVVSHRESMERELVIEAGSCPIARQASPRRFPSPSRTTRGTAGASLGAIPTLAVHPQSTAPGNGPLEVDGVENAHVVARKAQSLARRLGRCSPGQEIGGGLEREASSPKGSAWRPFLPFRARIPQSLRMLPRAAPTPAHAGSESHALRSPLFNPRWALRPRGQEPVSSEMDS